MASKIEGKQIEKRVVVYVVTGRWKGMRRIIGHLIYEVGAELPKAFEKVHICDGESPKDVHLVGEYPRHVLYSEIITPSMLKRPKIKVISNGTPTKLDPPQGDVV